MFTTVHPDIGLLLLFSNFLPEGQSFPSRPALPATITC